MKTYKKTVVTEEPLLTIFNDRDSDSPRDWDNLGYFITVDRNYTSPDDNLDLKRIITETQYESEVVDCDSHMALIEKTINQDTDETVLAIYPVVKYEHGGVSYSLGARRGFDYSNNGFYIVTEKSRAVAGINEKNFERDIKIELETYNKWANGDIYGFNLVDTDGEHVDSCSGFYDLEDIKEHLPKEYKTEDLSEYIVNDY